MKKIVIIPNATRDPDYIYTQKAETLLQNRGFTTHRFNPSCQNDREDALFQDAHAVLVLGGDGTILNAAHFAAKYDVPILAVNLGRLGYIAQLELKDLDSVADILDSSFTTEERSMLSVTLRRNGDVIYHCDTALNDAVIGKLNGCGIIEFELLANRKTVSFYRGDGMIFASATGSTAYSMSAGGPVIDPSLSIIEVTPLAAHSLKARPIVFSGEQTLDVVILPSQSNPALTIDGETTVKLKAGDTVTVTRSDKVTRLIAYQNDFCHILYQKMSDL